MQALKKHDEGRSFKANKLRATVGCDECGAVRCIYSVYAVGAKRGPRQSQLDSLLGLLDNSGYVCGGSINEDGGFFVKRQMRCGDYIE